MLVDTFRAARRVSTPLIAISTPDPGATIALLRDQRKVDGREVQGIGNDVPIVIWDSVRGWTTGNLQERNNPGQEAINAVVRTLMGQAGTKAPTKDEISAATLNPVEAMIAAQYLPRKTVLFVHNAHRYLGDSTAAAAFIQATWNLRDWFKSDVRTAVLLGPSFTLPPELAGDVLQIDEPLPGDDELKGIVLGIAEAAKFKTDAGLVERAVDALRGLAAFPAEQATAMSITGTVGNLALDVDALWERKRQMIAATPGLSVERGGGTLDDIGGNKQIKMYLRRLLKGKNKPRAVAFIDEIEKMIAGATNGTGDSSGVSQGFLGQLLTYLQKANDRGSSGIILVGPPGTGKSALALATGNEGAIPTITVDLGAMKGSLVGQSEAQLRTALKVLDAVSGGRLLVIATCNKEADLPPELKRRFTAGTFYCDLPDEEEREVIWQLYLKRFGIADAKARPKGEEWTGAEIKQACTLVDNLGMALGEVEDFIVPVAKSAAKQIAALRAAAEGRFLSASKPGFYVQPQQPQGKDAPRGRTRRIDPLNN